MPRLLALLVASLLLVASSSSAQTAPSSSAPLAPPSPAQAAPVASGQATPPAAARTAPASSGQAALVQSAPAVAGAPGSAAAAPRAWSTMCSNEQLERARTRRGAIVSIESAGMHLDSLNPWTLQGFVVASPRHVVTATRGRGLGPSRPMWVRFEDGRRIGATPVAVLPGPDELVLPELDAPAPVAPLELAADDPGPGTPVIAVSQWRREIDLRRGALAGGPGVELAFRSGVEGYPSSTTPYLDCEGLVVGAASERGSRLAFSPASRLRALLSLPAGTVPEVPRVSLVHGSVGLLVQSSTRTWVGGALGGALTVDDRFQLRLDAGLLSTLRDQETDRRAHRFQVETRAGYRLLLADIAVPLYVVPEIGLAASWDSRSPGGEPARRLRPTFGAHLLGWAIDLGYSFQPGSDRSSRQHQLTVGMMF